MSRSAEYTRLTTDGEENVSETPQQLQQPVIMTLSIEGDGDGEQQGDKEYPSNFSPPPYEAVAKLPTYDEAQGHKDGYSDSSSDEDERGVQTDGNTEVMKLGGDLVFVCSFVVSFIFNWLGFLFAFCMSRTIASRYGAIAGFGLSTVKWIVIMKNSSCCDDYFDGMEWCWWILIVLGVSIFVRATITYIRVKQAYNAGIKHKLLYLYIF